MVRRVFCKLLLVVVAVFSFLAFSGVLYAQGRSEEALEHAKAVQERHTEALMVKAGVIGTAVGLNENSEHTMLVLLERPGVAGIPQVLEGIPVRTIVTGQIVARSAANRFLRPVPIGVSTGHPAITAGTIGCRVTDSTNVYALSNNHVYANQNLASIGDSVIQPGTYDGGSSPTDDIGNLFDFEPIVFSRRASNEIDAAIALSSTGLLGNATPGGYLGYGTPKSSIVDASLGQFVQKFGRTTELTHGQVTGINAIANVSYGAGKTAKFVKQIIIEPGSFSAGGDSGSLIVTDDSNRNPVGLLFAGSSSVTIANRIDLVLSRFGVTIDGSSTSTPLTPSTGSINGIVTNANDTTPIVGAVVSLDTGESATTADDGSYKIQNVPTGNRLVTASANGFESQTDTATVNENDTTEVNFALTPVQSGGTLNVNVSTDKDTYTIGERVLITVTVTAVDGSEIEGAVVDVQISTPTGKLYGGETTTNSTGEALFNFKIKKPDGIGDYDVDSNASKSGYDSGSGSTSFLVGN